MKKKRYRRMLPILFIAMAVLVSFLYVSDYYRASDEVTEYLENTADVHISEIREGLLIDGPGEDSALIFYPGGKVEYTAYVPLMSRIAGQGTDCFFIRMPANLAFLSIGKAGRIIKNGNYKHWYIGGHSLGGVAASMYAADHDLDGLILLASYPVRSVDEKTLEIYGSEDGVLNMKKRSQADRFLPEEDEVEVIEGGSHAQFGNYGLQKGDGTADITADEQQDITARKILEMTGQ